MPFDLCLEHIGSARVYIFGKCTFTRHAVTTQVVANSARAATGVLGSREAELWASTVVYLARVSSWMLSTTRQKASNKVLHMCVGSVCFCVYICVIVCWHVWACLPFWPSLSYTFIWTTPLVLFLRITRFRPSLLVTVPSWADSSSAHQSLPPVTINGTSLKNMAKDSDSVKLQCLK